jgi:hypothetical protein
VPPPAPGFFEHGGWLYVTLAASGDAAALLGLPDALKLYAVRVPWLGSARSLFSAVLFPVAAAPLPGPYDDLFVEAIDYDDGFAKAVHGTQPRAADLLREHDDGTRPINEIGIRLGWDDEQVTIWLNRQLDADPAVAQLDAPMGVFGYRVDVRQEGETGWHSLCRAKGPVGVGPLAVGAFDGESAVETHPVQLEGEKTGTFWLPIYYASWVGPPLVGIDTIGHRLVGGADKADPSRVQGVAPGVDLRYGKTYEFRVRLMDHTGGGPAIAEEPAHPAPAPIGRLPFRRFLRPQTAKLLDELPAVPDPTAPPAVIHLRRPRLGYPAYVFTGASNAVAELLADLPAAKAEEREVGLPDPDVGELEIRVQVQALGLDTAPGGGTDAGYHTVYVTTRSFPADPTQPLAVELDWRDVKDADSLAPGPTAGAIAVPTARNVRLVFVPVGKPDPMLAYFGAADVRYGPLVFVDLRKPSADERALLVADDPVHQLKALYLQPDLPADPVVAFAQKAAGKGLEGTGAVVERLGAALGLAVDGLTLRGKSGRRVVFGCSAAIRHVLGPDGSTLTFASKGDLLGHWLVALQATLDRDWTWDGLAHAGIAVFRDKLTRQQCPDGLQEPQGPVGVVGNIQLVHTVNADALVEPQRSQTDLLFLDAVEPKPEPGQFPGELGVTYRLAPQFSAPPAQSDADLELAVRLPMTTPPAQLPRLVSAGIALSQYVRSADYSSTAPRQRSLWLEFDRPPDNPCDAYFCRMLRYAPDPLLVSGPEISEAAEPPLPIDPELIRTVVPGQSDDRAGAGVMQRLILSDSPVHFVVPLPPGVHDDSPELFGFFTYEIRVGHDRDWSTAQGRFGTALRVTGVQHPAPPLTCVVSRNSAGILASAPFANPVFQDQSFRRFPPATRIWVLLYAQVVQSDGADRRNVLLGRRPARFEHSDFESKTRADFGTATWSNDEVVELLAFLTLRPDNPLSCLAVEVQPGDLPFADPMGADLGHERILRTSPLVPIPAIC